MTNPVTITVPAGLPFIEIEREFERAAEELAGVKSQGA